MRPDVLPYPAIYLQPLSRRDTYIQSQTPLMRKGTDPLSSQITRDRSELLYYAIPQGTNMSRTKPSFCLPPIPELPDSQMESPTYSQSSCDTGDVYCRPGARVDQRTDEDYLPLLVKDAKLQVYFFRMENTLRTHHTAAIHAEAVKLVQDVVTNPTDIASSIQTAAETLARAGYRKVEHSRSCALVAQEVFYQLRSISDGASDSFRGCLINAVMRVFEGHYLKTNLWHLGGLNGLSSVDEEMINVAGLAGDLFSLGLLPVGVVHGTILANLAYANQVSTIHCRALHLFLLHAKADMGPSIGREVLLGVRKQLVRCVRGPPMAYDVMAQLWVIECCAVIDRTLEQGDPAGQGCRKSTVGSHQSGMIPPKDGWFSALIS